MRRVWLRVGLVVAMLGAVGASSYQIFLAEQRIAGHQRAEQAFVSDTWMLEVALGDLRAAQHAYVSAGQDDNYWMVDVSRRFEGVAAQLAALARDATAAGAALDEAEALLASLKRLDVQIREHVLAERPLMASDLIFTDTGELTSLVADQIDRARTVERATHQAAAAAGRRTEGVLLAGGASAILLAILLLLPPAGAARPAEDEETDGAGTARQLLGLKETSGGRPTALPAAEVTQAAEEGPEVTGAAQAEPREPTPDLQRAADLCTDLVRSTSPADLPALLARAAQVLNASGVIVWVLDGSGDALRPAIGHGYSAAALARIGQLPCDGDNATAAAWRDGLMHVVASNGYGAYGAIVAPLTSPGRCSGVLSLELNDGWERSEAVQSTVEIIAAQLATLVSADPGVETAHRARARARARG